jgi:hypothetical protein
MVLEDATLAMLLDANDNPLSSWNPVYNLNPRLEHSHTLFGVDMAIVGRSIDAFQDAVMVRPPFSDLCVLVRRRSSNHDYYIFKNCIFQSFQTMEIGERDRIGYGEMKFLCQRYEIHTSQRIQIIRPVGSQQSRPQVDPNLGVENRLRNLGDRNPDCGRDSDGPVDWLNNGF